MEEEECVICRATPRTTRFLPCRHALACTQCARTLLDGKGLNALPCPYCRQTVSAVEAMAPAEPKAAPADLRAYEWPRRVRVIAEGGPTRFADFPPKDVWGGPFAALRATVSAKCFPGEATPVVIQFKDSYAGGPADGWAAAEDDGNIALMVEMWREEGRRQGRAIPLVPTLRVDRATGAAAAIAVAASRSAVDYPVGTVVVLAEGYESIDDSMFGPLLPGDRGVIISSDGSEKPYNVALNGRSCWYKRNALCEPGAGNEARRPAHEPPRTSPFRHARHDHVLTWQPSKEGSHACRVCNAAGVGVMCMRCGDGCDWECCQACREKEETRTLKLVVPAVGGRPALFVGDRVVRGPTWKWAEQDGGAGGVGSVIGRSENGWTLVEWDANKLRNHYRYGAYLRADDIALRGGGDGMVVGAEVVLSHNFDAVADAAQGCLIPGISVGTVVDVRPSATLRSLVLVRAGADEWSYGQGALCPRGDPCAAAADFAAETSVVLRIGYEHTVGGTDGPLQPGVAGKIIAVDRLRTIPYHVQAPDGKRWWYCRRALCLPECEDAAPATGSMDARAAMSSASLLLQIMQELHAVAS